MMNEAVKSIYLYWVGLSNKNKAYDVKGLPLPIPITGIEGVIKIDSKYIEKHNLIMRKGILLHELAKQYQDRILSIAIGVTDE